MPVSVRACVREREGGGVSTHITYVHTYGVISPLRKGDQPSKAVLPVVQADRSVNITRTTPQNTAPVPNLWYPVLNPESPLDEGAVDLTLENSRFNLEDHRGKPDSYHHYCCVCVCVCGWVCVYLILMLVDIKQSMLINISMLLIDTGKPKLT